MTGTDLMEATHAGERPSEVERFVGRWADELSAHAESLLPEGRDCYDDSVRAEAVEASYASIDEKVAEAEPGEPVLLIGRSALTLPRNLQERSSSHEFRRSIALGELAGQGYGLFLDYRGGQVVLPTARYSHLVRHSPTAIKNHSVPALHTGALSTGVVLGHKGLLPTREELMDRELGTEISAHASRTRLVSAQKSEIWNRMCDIAIGQEEVDALMEYYEKFSPKRMRKPYVHDFSILRAVLEG